MSDGFNDVRAMRIAELLTDYQAIQTQTANFSTLLQNADASSAGAAVMRQVIQQSQILLSRPVPAFNNPPSPGEGTRLQLQAVMVDAAARRFVAWRLYQRGAAAQRWFQRRNQLLQGKPPRPDQQQALSAIDNGLRTEIIAVTDSKIMQELNQRDVAAGHWTAEMPNLPKILQYVQQNGF